jgi:DNA-binding NtrC family response regulator
MALRRIIEDQGCDVTPVSDGQQALDALAKGGYALVVTDLRMPEADGMQVLRAAQGRTPPVPVVVLTGYGTVERAVEAMRLGAANFLTKPFEIADVEGVVREVLNLKVRVAESGGGRQREDAKGRVRKDGADAKVLIGASPAMARVHASIEQVADSDVTVLLLGESGTGKEVVAHLIHERSCRSRGPFIPVNCAAIPEPLLESELFGHARGSFTGATQARTGRFALAAGGTLFLDEIAEMTPGLQAKVLRVLQDREVTPVGGSGRQRIDVRIVAATNRDLQRMVEAGQFREDLYYRLNVIPIHMPPLRERTEDIPALCEHFLQRSCARRGRARAALRDVLDDSALRQLRRHTWPGNVRELENLIERIVHLHPGGGPISAADLAVYLGGGGPRQARAVELGERGRMLQPALPEGGLDLRGQLEYIEQSLLTQAITRTGGNQRQAAALLRMNRTTLIEKLRRYQVGAAPPMPAAMPEAPAPAGPRILSGAGPGPGSDLDTGRDPQEDS